MSEQKTQVQRAFDKLIEACPKEWVICQQQVLIEDLRAEVEQSQAQNAEVIAKNDAAVGDRG